MYQIYITNKFEKDLKKICKHKDFSPHKLQEVIDILEAGIIIDSKYKNHRLHGSLSDTYDLHIQNDLILLYEKDEEIRLIALIRLNNHSELF